MELTHFEAAERYLNDVMNGRTGIPLKAWKAEQEKLTAERKKLSRRIFHAERRGKGSGADTEGRLQYPAGRKSQRAACAQARP